MGYLYIIKSEDGRFYVGSTVDIERRMKQHFSGQTPTTKRMANIKLVFCQKYKSILQARKIERKIKGWKRKDFIEKIIEDGFVRIK